jgi:hypothetical protein
MSEMTGGCLCGAVRYAIREAPRVGALCHCRSCRLAAAAPSVAWTVVAEPAFAFTSGEPARFASSPGVERTFCPACGTALTYRNEGRPEVDVTTASLDAPEACPPSKEIFVAERIAWEAANPDLPQFAGSSVGAEPLS